MTEKLNSSGKKNLFGQPKSAFMHVRKEAGRSRGCFGPSGWHVITGLVRRGLNSYTSPEHTNQATLKSCTTDRWEAAVCLCVWDYDGLRIGRRQTPPADQVRRCRRKNKHTESVQLLPHRPQTDTGGTGKHLVSAARRWIWTSFLCIIWGLI